MNPLDITNAYQEHVGSKPLLDTAVLASTAGAGTYMASGPLLKLLVNLVAKVRGPEAGQQIADWLGSDINKTKRRLALLAASLGAGYGVYKHGDFSKGWQGFKKSMTKPDYWDDPDNWPVDKDSPEGMLKLSELDITRLDNIPVLPSMQIISRDPVLIPDQKTTVNTILMAASNGKPRTSQFDLTKTVLQTGVDFGAAYLFGKGLGSILSLPKPVVNTLSLTGGIGYAIKGSGILDRI